MKVNVFVLVDQDKSIVNYQLLVVTPANVAVRRQLLHLAMYFEIYKLDLARFLGTKLNFFPYKIPTKI